ncbi:MAG: Cna B-type domain-containing protein, partial [Lachnospiraceae bacterium]|nr:Cna B-type domain-containing protein [Lachnospiraceae bacterium]
MYIVNTPKTSLKVTKNWDDEDNRQGIREEVTVTLENDGEFGVSPQAEQELTTEKDSSVEWKYLPIYKKPNPDFVKSNKEHTDNVDYTIIEASIEKYNDPEYSFGDKKHTSDNGYTINLSGSGNEATITNTHNPYRIKFTATKKWDDENNRHFSRPVQKGIYLTLYYSTDNKNWYKVMNPPDDYVGGNYPDGTSVYTISNVTQHITNNGTNTWGEGVWEGLPTRVAGKTKLYYKAFETKENGDRKVTPGYSATYTPSSIEVYSKAAGSTVKQEVTNTLNRTSILVSKEWKETYDVIDRPDTVSFVIEYKCGIMDSWKVYKDKNGSVLKVNLTGSDLKIGTTHTWEKKIDNLPSMNSEGTSYEYRVKEVSVAYNGSDEIPAYGVLSDDVSTSIFTQDGKKWTSESTVGAFKDSVVTESYKGSGYSYKVTAVNEPITGKLTVVKKWDDECNRDNLRPEEIRLQLYRKQDQATPVLYGEAVVIGPNVPGTTEINNNEWSYTFDKLPVYNNDSYEHTDENKSIYYVKEVDPKHGYDVTYTTETVDSTNKFNEAHNILKHNVSDNTYSASEVITNKYEPLRIKIKAHKEWEDDNNKQNTRPDSLKFKLQYHIVDENDENTPVVWRDVESVSSQSDLDKTGEKVETTSVLTKTLTKEKNDVITPVSVWDKDENGEAIIWENLPAYVNNGQSVQYRILEYDISKNSDLYRVKYDHCEYENEYGTEDYYTLKALNVLKDMYGELTVEKKWNPEKRDDIANNDKIISEIKCHLEQKLPGEEWQVLSGWGEFSLSHSENWQHTLVHKLTALAEYKVVEDAIVYKDGETISRVLDSDGIARIGSFICSEIPDVVKANSDTADMNVTITNTVPNKSITVNKVWLDENNRDGKRPHSIKVRLKRDGKPVGEDVTLYPKTDAVGSEWYDHEWKNLPVYKNGYLENGELVKSKYTVE